MTDKLNVCWNSMAAMVLGWMGIHSCLPQTHLLGLFLEIRKLGSMDLWLGLNIN